MRDPSIHIRRSHLVEIMESLEIDTSKVNTIMEKALKYSIRNRSIVVGNYKTRKSVERTSAVDINIVEDFNRTYDAIIKSKGIKAITVKKTDPAYLTMKEIAKQAYDFCQMFELAQSEGFRIYIETGIELLERKFSLYRLKSYADRIVSSYQNALVVTQDENKEGTKKAYESWQRALQKHFGQIIEINTTDKYVNFVYARQDADLMDADYFDWMDAQFQKWSFVGIIPELSQLHGENAALYYKTYITQKYKNDTTTEREHFKKVQDKKITLKKDKQERGRGKA